jgi:hypothetical protein
MIRCTKTLAIVVLLLIQSLNLTAQDLPWGDNFDDGDYAGWSIFDDAPFSSGPSQWLVLNGELLQTSNIFTNENEYNVFTGTHIIAGNKDWSDYYFAARLRTSDDDGIGMVFRYQNPKNYYRFLTVEDPGNRGPFKRLEKQVDGQFTLLAESTSDMKVPGNFVGKVLVVDDSIYVYEDNELLFAIRDNAFSAGKVGFMCYANTEAIFDDVYVGEQDSVYEKKGEMPDPEVLTKNEKLQVRALTFNIWVGGRICTPQQVTDLIESLDLDFAGLQECNYDFGTQVAELTGMHLVAGADCFLLSRTPYIKVKNLPVQGINAWTNINGQTVSVYNFHIGWDESGDRAARRMVDELWTTDPVPLQIAFGDFNDEHYSTQITILEEHMRYCLADLGWAPSQRVTWPAFGFYGGEGAQTIDLMFCNKESKGRAIAGEIINTSPMLSDHKPVWAMIEYPADKETIGPKLTGVIPYFGEDMIELWFDQDVDAQSAGLTGNYQISSLDDGAAVSVAEASLSKDPRRVRLTTSAHDEGKKYQITISGLMDEFGIANSSSSALDYTVRKNLLENVSAEDGITSWQVMGGFTTESERENQTPYTGNYFFTGANMEDLSSGMQVIDLSPWADDIDAGIMAAEWNCFFATGYEILGDIKASRCEPYDEGEMFIEFLDEAETVLIQASSKRWDTLYWHPYGETTLIPAGTRKAKVYLHSYRKTANGVSNDAAFENAFFSLKKLEQPHNYGKNLLENASAEMGDLTGWANSGSLWAREHENNKARPVSGYYLFSNSGASSGDASQTIDISDYARQIDSGNLGVRWGGYMRDYIGDSSCEIQIAFYDGDKEIMSFEITGSHKVAEWTLYDTETIVPVGTRSIRFVLRFNALDLEGAYFDFLHLIPFENKTTPVAHSKIIDGFQLYQNYPNPFNAGTTIAYQISDPEVVSLIIYNTLGQKIAVLVDEFQQPGSFKISWDGRDSFARIVPSGIYIMELRTPQFCLNKKLMHIK